MNVLVQFYKYLNQCCMEHILSTGITVGVVLLFWVFMRFSLGVWSPNKILRGIDQVLSKSQLKQIYLLALFVLFVFLFLVSFSAIFNPVENRGFWFRFWSSLAHFFEPGNFNSDDGVPNSWIIILNLFGMVFMTSILISVLSNFLERRMDQVKNGRIYYKKLF